MKRCRLLFIGLLIILFASCAGKKDDSSVVRTRTMSEIDSLDPYLSTASDTEAIMHNVFEGLVGYDPSGAVIPALAEAWRIEEDGLCYTFFLRPDVLFHDGSEFDADDVVWSISKYAGLDTGRPLSSKFSCVESVEALDDRTVEIRLKEINASFLQLLSAAITPSGYEDNATRPIGTGPYKFVSYTPGQKVVLEKNASYYETERIGKIDRAEFYVMTDESAVVTALSSGQLDFAIVNGDNADVLSSRFDIYSNPQNMVQIFALNNSISPFDDERVRMAFNMAVDKDEIIKGVFNGYATKLYSAFSPVMAVYYNDELDDMYPFDAEAARALLAQAGYPDGFDLVITVPSNYQPHVDTAQIISEQLKKIGVKVEIELVEWATWLEKVYKNADYEATIIGLSGMLDPNDILVRYTSYYSRNFVRYDNARYDRLISSAILETDDAQRAAMYKEAQQVILEDAGSVFICDPNQNIVCRKDLKGYVAYPVPFTDISRLHFE